MHGFLRRSALLLGSLPGLGLLSQASLPAGQQTPDTLRQFCAAQVAASRGAAPSKAPSCAVPLDGQHTLHLSGDWQVPSSMHLRFAPGSALHVTGGVLQFAGGSVEAPAGELIFPDGDRVRGLAAARPEWFASAGQNVQGEQNPLPATALADAYRATEPWGSIYLQARAYTSPFSGCPPDLLRYLSPRTLVGAGRPVPDDPVQPTHLQDGTVLLGGIVGTAPIRLAHLGIDAGPQVSAGVLHGCELPGIFIEQPGRQFVSGDRLEDISVLTAKGINMHSVMIAGHRDAEVRGLWIWTLGGTHGLVMKSSDSLVDGLHCWGAVSDCLIVKSDYATDFLGRAVHDRVAHVDIHPLQPDGYVGGIMVESRWDTVGDLEMEDITQTHTHFAIILLGSTFYRPRNISIRGWKADNVSGICLFADNADAVQVSDFQCGLLPSAQAGAVLRGSRNTLLQRGSFRCEASASSCSAGQTDGVDDDSAGTSLRQITAQGLGGYLVRSMHPAPPPGSNHAEGMDGRLFQQYRVSVRDRLQAAFAQTKPNLRILYTAVATRAAFRPRLYGGLAALLAVLAAWEFAYRRRHSARRRHSQRP